MDDINVLIGLHPNLFEEAMSELVPDVIDVQVSTSVTVLSDDRVVEKHFDGRFKMTGDDIDNMIEGEKVPILPTLPKSGWKC